MFNPFNTFWKYIYTIEFINHCVITLKTNKTDYACIKCIENGIVTLTEMVVETTYKSHIKSSVVIHLVNYELAFQFMSIKSF